jgi:hypothetical protein
VAYTHQGTTPQRTEPKPDVYKAIAAELQRLAHQQSVTQQPTPTTVRADADALRAEAAELASKADKWGGLDRQLATGYRQRATELLTKASAVDSAGKETTA